MSSIIDSVTSAINQAVGEVIDNKVTTKLSDAATTVVSSSFAIIEDVLQIARAVRNSVGELQNEERENLRELFNPEPELIPIRHPSRAMYTPETFIARELLLPAYFFAARTASMLATTFRRSVICAAAASQEAPAAHTLSGTSVCTA